MPYCLLMSCEIKDGRHFQSMIKEKGTNMALFGRDPHHIKVFIILAALFHIPDLTDSIYIFLNIVTY